MGEGPIEKEIRSTAAMIAAMDPEKLTIDECYAIVEAEIKRMTEKKLTELTDGTVDLITGAPTGYPVSPKADGMIVYERRRLTNLLLERGWDLKLSQPEEPDFLKELKCL